MASCKYIVYFSANTKDASTDQLLPKWLQNGRVLEITSNHLVHKVTDPKCALFFFVIREYHGLKECQNLRNSDWGAMSLDVSLSCIHFVRI